MPPPAGLSALLAKGTFAPDKVSAIAAHCDCWYATAADLESFVFRSVFRDLINRGWADQQPQFQPGEFDRFEDDVLPRFAAVLIAAPHQLPATLADLVLAYHSTI